MSSTSTPDPQTWVYPPGGAANPPIGVGTANFGPIHHQDSIVLSWSPATSPDIVWNCFSQKGNQTNIYAVRGAQSPATYKFSQLANQASTSDTPFCKFYFTGTNMGNTVVFEYSNTPQQKAVTWQAGSASTTAVSTTTTSSSATSSASLSNSLSSTALSTGTLTPTTLVASSLTSTSSAAASSESSSKSSGLSAGAGAGIGVGVALGVILLAALAFIFLRRKRRTTSGQAMNGTHIAEIDGTPSSRYQDDISGTSAGHEYYKTVIPPVEMAGNHKPSELP